ncbi:M28 family peptidase [Pseudonocardiaceae bacterium YIM PH 21723]|nr:M28 family peptidase [Pseudonocardiaceae bacterium YIM PH 21723]
MTLPAVASATPSPADQLARKVTATGVNRHLVALQRIADKNKGTRAVQTPGYDASLDYVAGKLRDAGFLVDTPEFPYETSTVEAAAVDVGGVKPKLVPLTYSKSTPAGGVTAPLAVVPENANTGCAAADYAGVPAKGAIVLIRRGGCTFAEKQRIAFEQGAVAAIISNNADGGPVSGTLGSPDAAKLPVGGVSKEDGNVLAGKAGTQTTLDIRVRIEARTAKNIIAQTRTGRADNVVMAGAHLDSVEAGPGINDDGSGTASLLETALQLGSAPKTKNAIRFGWWGAEELGLVGSTKYVESLSFEEQLNIALYLNFDMVGSPNAGYFVFDGDDSDKVGAGPGPYGSAQIEKAFQDYFTGTGVPTEGTDFTGRSDYGGFIAAGIPAGGLFTGGELIKSEAQAKKWGGKAGTAFDACYHQACDNLGNIDRTALGRNAQAIAYVTASYGASTESVNGVPSRANRLQQRQAFVAPHLDGDPDCGLATA